MRQVTAVFIALVMTVGCGHLRGPGAETPPTASAARTQSPTPSSSSAGCLTASQPGPRMFMVFVYMPDRQEALLFGGSDASHTSVEETWVWSAGCWAQQAPANSPPGRDFAAAAYDLVNHEVLVYGGRGNGQFYSDTWAWNGKSWTQVAAVGPPDLLPSAVAGFDPVTQRVLLFGAARDGSAQTWTWDGLRWQQLSPTRTPEGREAPSLVGN